MRKRALVSACVVLIAAGGSGCASKPPIWRPIPGAKVTSWEQTQAICDPVLQSGEAAVKGGGGESAEMRAKAQWRSCMARHGWTDRTMSPQNQAVQRERDDALRREAEELKAEIQKRRTKNALTLYVGVAPECQPGDPGTEICSWRWKWKSKTQEASAPIHMTCVLPKSGKPRDAESCRVDPGT
jgi:hypothetical protein